METVEKHDVVEGTDLLCFVHNVSPLKQSKKTSYFTAELQTSPNHVVRAVSFSPKKRALFCKHQNEKSSVKISRFKISSRQGSDVIINDITAIAPAQVPFIRQEICSSTLSTISSLQNVSLVKITSNASGSLKKREEVLVDERSSIKVVLWENHVDKLEEGHTYILGNLRQKESRGDKYVNTPKTGEFTCEAAAELQHLADNHHIELETVHTLLASIIGISSVTKSLSCVGCRGKVQAESKDGKFATCTTCKMWQTTSACPSSWFASIMIHCEDDSSDNNIRLAVFNSQFLKLISLTSLPSSLATASMEEVCEHILLLETVKVTYDAVKKHLIDVDVI